MGYVISSFQVKVGSILVTFPMVKGLENDNQFPTKDSEVSRVIQYFHLPSFFAVWSVDLWFGVGGFGLITIET